MARLHRFHELSSDLRDGVKTLAAALLLSLVASSAGTTRAFASEDENEPAAREDYRPYRRAERDSERESKGFFSGLFDGSLFSSKASAVQVDYLLMESARLDTLIGTGSGRGASVTVSASRGNPIFEIVGRVRFHSAQGESSIQDRAALRELPFLLVGGDALLGISVNLLPGEFKGMQPYFGTAYKLGLNHLSLTGVPDENSDLSGSSTGLFGGSELFVGVRAASRYVIEFQLRQSMGAIGGLENIGIGGAALSLGYRW